MPGYHKMPELHYKMVIIKPSSYSTKALNTKTDGFLQASIMNIYTFEKRLLTLIKWHLILRPAINHIKGPIFMFFGPLSTEQLQKI